MHNCASFLAHYRVIRNIPDASFTFTEMVLGKMLLPPGAISHGLASIFVDSSFFSRDCNSSLGFYVVFTIFLVCMHLVGPCNFVNVICN